MTIPVLLRMTISNIGKDVGATDMHNFTGRMQIESTSFFRILYQNGVAIASPIIPLFPKIVYKEIGLSIQRHCV